MANTSFNLNEKEKILENIDQTIGQLYLQYFKLRQMSEYQEEYDSMGVLLGMLQQDRRHMREKFDINF